MPENWNLRGNLNVVYGNHALAIEDYTKAISLKSDYSEAFYNRGLVYLMIFQQSNACRDLKQSLQLGYAPANNIIVNFCTN